MNSRDRIALAMQHQLPDRVPVMCQLALGHYFLHSGLAPHDIWFTSEGFAEALVTLQRRYRFDGILVNLPGRPPHLLDQVDRIEKTAEGEMLTWRNGDQTFIPWDDNPHPPRRTPTAALRADFAAIDPDNLDFIDGLKGYIWNTYHVPRLDDKGAPGPLSEPPGYFFRTIDLVRAKAGDESRFTGRSFRPSPTTWS